MRHPSEVQLALWAGGDLPRLDGWLVRRHVARCSECETEVRSLRGTGDQLKELASELPQDLNWSRLAQEMTGNIGVGLAAGKAIAAFDRPLRSRPARLGLNAVLVLGCATAVFVVAFSLSLPRSEAQHLLNALNRIRVERIGKLVQHSGAGAGLGEGVVLEASSSAIEVKENDRAMSLMHPNSDGATVSVNLQGSAGVRFVDADTGQVTTNKVYYGEP
jgi:hypothetical protein